MTSGSLFEFHRHAYTGFNLHFVSLRSAGHANAGSFGCELEMQLLISPENYYYFFLHTSSIGNMQSWRTMLVMTNVMPTQWQILNSWPYMTYCAAKRLVGTLHLRHTILQQFLTFQANRSFQLWFLLLLLIALIRMGHPPPPPPLKQNVFRINVRTREVTPKHMSNKVSQVWIKKSEIFSSWYSSQHDCAVWIMWHLNDNENFERHRTWRPGDQFDRETSTQPQNKKQKQKTKRSFPP